MPYEWRDDTGVPAFARGGIVLSSFPSAGLAATVAAHYIVRTLKLPRIGRFHSEEAIPIAVVQGGQVHPPVRVYGRPDLALVLSEFPPVADSAASIAEAILRGAETRGARHVIGLEGVVPHPIGPEEGEEAPGRGEQESVWVAHSRPDPKVSAWFESAHARTLEEGVIGGVSGALLVSALESRVPLSVLLVSARATEGYPDHRAGAALIEAVDRLLPEIAIDTGPLRSQAELIERALRAAMAAHRREPKGDSEAEPRIYG